MVDFYIYAKDISSSTCSNRHYHSNGLKTVTQFKNDVETIKKELLDSREPPMESKVIYLHWGDKCYEVDEAITVTAYQESCCGNMGTEPETIIKWIRENCDLCKDKNNKIRLLYIITDGSIDARSAVKCSQLNENVNYEKFVFHAFNTNLNSIDLSVAASFLRNQCKIYRNYELFTDTNLSEEFNYDKINVNNFYTEKDKLKSYIHLKCINEVNKQINQFKDNFAVREIDKLKKLRDRLFAELASKSEKSEPNLETKDREVFIRAFVNTHWYKNLIVPINDVKVDIEKSISILINYIVSDTKSYSFDALKFEKTFHKFVEEEPIVDVNFKTEQKIEFTDIILDDDKGIPVILLTELNLFDKIIFHRTHKSNKISSASFNKFKSAMECPLFLVNDRDISDSIGYFYTLNVYKQLLTNYPKTEPRTRRTFHGGLVLIDSDEFDKYNDYILSATYFNSKKMNYNIGLFYYVLWKNCENKEWMEKNVVEQFKKYAMRRISETTCKIGLSSLPLDPPAKTSLPTALWYCVELSSRIFKDDPNNFVYERLRMFYGIAHCMIEILHYFNYDLDLEFIENRRDIIRHTMILKKNPTYKEKVYYLLKRIFKNVNGFIISQVEKPFNLYKLNYLKLNHKELLRDDIRDEKVDLNEYILLMHVSNLERPIDDKHAFDLCDKTFRPFFTIDQNTSFYSKLVGISKKVIINNDNDNLTVTYEALDCLEFDKFVSFYNLFIKCVIDFEEYPTFSEYIEYISRKKKYHGNLVTIFPPEVYADAEYVFWQYENLISRVEVNQFISVCKKYVSRIERIKAEGILKFKSYKEIEVFISQEELKVNLKKTAHSHTFLKQINKFICTIS